MDENNFMKTKKAVGVEVWARMKAGCRTLWTYPCYLVYGGGNAWLGIHDVGQIRPLNGSGKGSVVERL